MRDPQDTLNDAGLFVPSYNPGRYYTTCPQCSAGRQTRHQKLKCVGITIKDDKVFWGCNHCGWTGPEAGSSGGFREPKAAYCYGDDVRKVRSGFSGGPKYYWQHQNGGGSWDKGSGEADLGDRLYRIEECQEAIAAGEPVLVVEGEKDVDTCWGMGFAATCNAHGAADLGQRPKWRVAHSLQLHGADLVVLNDNDAPGDAHAEAVCNCSLGAAKSIRRLVLKDDWPAMPAGADVTDWMNQGGTAAELQDLIDGAPLWAPAPGETPSATPSALTWADIGWDDVPVPELKWSVHGRIPSSQVCILSGHGATGKSTIGLHLAAAHAVSTEWLKALVTPGPAFFIDAEDTLDIIHIRLNAITEFFACSYEDLIKGGLHVLPLAGEDAVMAVASPKSGVLTATKLYHQVLQQAGDIRPVQIVIANAANVFAGNESDRSQVQQFVGMLKKIAIVSGGSVTLISHPSLTGLSTETGLSGSTQWHNAVRARMWLRGIKGNGVDKQEASDLRVLECMKNQYGKAGEEIELRWRDGMFLPVVGVSGIDKIARERDLDETFFGLLKRFEREGRRVSEAKSPTYAPAKFEEEPEAVKLKATRREFEGSMRRLLKDGKIVVRTWGSPSRQRTYLETVL